MDNTSNCNTSDTSAEEIFICPLVGKSRCNKPVRKKLIKKKKKTFGGLITVLRAKEKFLAKIPFQSRKLYRLGERGSRFRTLGPIQDFYKIRDQCLAEGILFEDPEFPANVESIYVSKKPRVALEWKRPHEIVQDPQFLVNGVSRSDVKQHSGDCWFSVALGIITMYPKLFAQVVPDDQSFTEKYAGVFHFRFWRYGRWVDVVIDDKLPTCNGQLYFSRTIADSVFWSALAEKAYAKLHKSYEALVFGRTGIDAFEDLTGGLGECYTFDDKPNFYEFIREAYEKSDLIYMKSISDTSGSETINSLGIVADHAYCVTMIKELEVRVPMKGARLAELVRIRNPWGQPEWSGLWSKKSPIWDHVPDVDKTGSEFSREQNGEFWMDITDVRTYFNMIGICHLSWDSISEEDVRATKTKRWEMSVFEGEWVKGATSGGKEKDTIASNPQYRVTLTEGDEGDEEDLCTVIIQVMQKHRINKTAKGITNIAIGFLIYHLKYPDRLPKPLDKKFFFLNEPVGASNFIENRSVCDRFRLAPGCYCIVPTTHYIDEEAQFIIRVYSEHKSNLEEYDQDDSISVPDEEQDVSNLEGITHIQKKQTKALQLSLKQKRERELVKKIFNQLADDDTEIDWIMLKRILDHALRNDIHGAGLRKDICRSMLAMMDTDHTGKIGFEEFKILWIELSNWKYIFKEFDKTESGSMKVKYLREALNYAGYNLNWRMLNLLVHRYGNSNGHISFEDFLLCVVRLRTMYSSPVFDNQKCIGTFTMEEWLETTMYA